MLTVALASSEAQAADYKVGLFGQGILSSRSPWLHKQEAAAFGVSLNYTLFDFAQLGKDEADLPAMLSQAEADSYSGLNITFPFKQSIIPLLDSLSDGAARIGAVNTVQFIGGKRIGHNTDVIGFAESMRITLPDAALGCVLQLGAGGAGSATAHALLNLGIGQLLLVDEDKEKVSALAAKLTDQYGANRAAVSPSLADASSRADGIVNATPMGMARYPGTALPATLLDARHWVADIVYFPLETELLRDARAKRCRVMDGRGMNVFQAAAAFDIFTGLTANRERMLQSFLDFTSAPVEKAA